MRRDDLGNLRIIIAYIDHGRTALVEPGRTRINVVDTPCHSDSGGEVERSLGIGDGVSLRVDACDLARERIDEEELVEATPTSARLRKPMLRTALPSKHRSATGRVQALEGARFGG